MIRTLAAVVIGLLVLVLVVGIGTAAAAALLLSAPPDGLPAQLTPAYLAANLLLSFLAAVAGGLAAGFVARRSSIVAVRICAALVFALAIIAMLAPGGAAPGQPGWYPVLLALIGPIGVLAGGWLRRLTAT